MSNQHGNAVSGDSIRERQEGQWALQSRQQQRPPSTMWLVRSILGAAGGGGLPPGGEGGATAAVSAAVAGSSAPALLSEAQTQALLSTLGEAMLSTALLACMSKRVLLYVAFPSGRSVYSVVSSISPPKPSAASSGDLSTRQGQTRGAGSGGVLAATSSSGAGTVVGASQHAPTSPSADTTSAAAASYSGVNLQATGPTQYIIHSRDPSVCSCGGSDTGAAGGDLPCYHVIAVELAEALGQVQRCHVSDVELARLFD